MFPDCLRFQVHRPVPFVQLLQAFPGYRDDQVHPAPMAKTIGRWQSLIKMEGTSFQSINNFSHDMEKEVHIILQKFEEEGCCLSPPPLPPKHRLALKVWTVPCPQGLNTTTGGYTQNSLSIPSPNSHTSVIVYCMDLQGRLVIRAGRIVLVVHLVPVVEQHKA